MRCDECIHYTECKKCATFWGVAFNIDFANSCDMFLKEGDSNDFEESRARDVF